MSRKLFTIMSVVACLVTASAGKKPKEQKARPKSKTKPEYKFHCEITAWDGKGLYPHEMICADKDGTKTKWNKTEQSEH